MKRDNIFCIGLQMDINTCSLSSSTIDDTDNFSISRGSNYYWIFCTFMDISFIIPNSLYKPYKNNNKLDNYLYRLFLKHCPVDMFKQKMKSAKLNMINEGKRIRSDEISNLLQNIVNPS